MPWAEGKDTVKKKREPSPNFDSTLNCPPSNSTCLRAMARPRPVPPALHAGLPLLKGLEQGLDLRRGDPHARVHHFEAVAVFSLGDDPQRDLAL